MVDQLSLVDGVGIKNLSPLPCAQSLVGTPGICCFFWAGMNNYTVVKVDG